MERPSAKKIRKVHSDHNKDREDPYFWMNERDSSDVLTYLGEENRYAESILEPTKPLQETLFAEMKARVKDDEQSTPVFRRGYHYYRRYEKGLEYPIYCRREGDMDAPEQIILNVNDAAAEKSYFDVASLSVSDDGRLLAWTVDEVGRRKFEIRFRNLDDDRDLDFKITNVAGNVAWASDNQTVFYSVKDEQTLRPYRIMRQSIDEADATLVFEEKDESFYASVYRTRSGKYIQIDCSSTLSSETLFIDAEQPAKEPEVFLPRRPDHLYDVEDHESGFYVLSNAKAPNKKLLKANEKDEPEDSWQLIKPHSKDHFIEDFSCFKDHIILFEKHEGQTKLLTASIASPKFEKAISFDESIFELSAWVNPSQDTNVAMLSYESMITPPSVIALDLDTDERKLIKRQFAGENYDPKHYHSERLYARAKDGTAIPISIVYRRDKAPLGDPVPLLLYGYGSYGYTIDPGFSSMRFSLLDRGVAFAFAHIRGSQFLGKAWYEDGKLKNKKNTFTDFIDCARFLIQSGRTRPELLFAEGGSAGGLLMGAVANLAPTLFRGILSHVPFVDVVTTMLDDTIPLTTFEYDEWGNPNQKEAFDYMLSYSPYDNVQEQSYPSMLVTTGYHDSQVQYWEPAKWVARLRDLKSDNNPLLFKTDMEAGHSGTTGRYQYLVEKAEHYAFILGILFGTIEDEKTRI